MSVDSSLVHDAASAPLAPRLSLAAVVTKFARTKPLGAGGACIILAMIFVATFAERLAPYDPYEADYAAQFVRPTAEHWFGTDAWSARTGAGGWTCSSSG